MFERFLFFWSDFNFLLAGAVFLSYFLIDALYARYTYDVISKRPFHSATIGSCMHFLLAFGVINYTENYMYIIPLALGSWFGTYAVVSRERNKSAK